MNNRKRNIQGFTISLLTFAIFVGIFVFIKNSSVSYAIDTGIDKSGLPSSKFNTNYTTTSTVNYIKDAVSSNNGNTAYLNNFFVPEDLMTSDNKTPLYILMKNLETPANSTESFELTTDNPTSITDNGLKYIISHGYNTTNTTNTVFTTNTYGSVTDNSIKQYITQVALWLYIYENNTTFTDNYCKDDACYFYDTSNNVITTQNLKSYISTCANYKNYGYLNYIIKLVSDAENYTGSQSSSIDVTKAGSSNYIFNDNFTLMMTETITPQSKTNNSNYLYYSVEIDDPNNYGAYIVDTNNNRISNTDIMNGSFKVAVPLEEDIESMDLTTIKVKVYGHYITNDGYAYRVTDSDNGLLKDKKTRYSDVMLGYVPSEVIEADFSLKNFVKISKIDAANSEELPGATLEITSLDDSSKKYSWVSTTTPHALYLENGDYKLCETIAPTGYTLKTECIEFSVDGNNIVSVTMENDTTVPTPDTGMFISKSIYIIGSLLIVIGISLIVVSYNKKQRLSSEQQQ